MWADHLYIWGKYPNADLLLALADVVDEVDVRGYPHNHLPDLDVVLVCV